MRIGTHLHCHHAHDRDGQRGLGIDEHVVLSYPVGSVRAVLAEAERRLRREEGSDRHGDCRAVSAVPVVRAVIVSADPIQRGGVALV